MIRAVRSRSDGGIHFFFLGEHSHLHAKALCAALSAAWPSGHSQVKVGGQRVEVTIEVGPVPGMTADHDPICRS